jgi:hypothetical protein
MIINVKRISKLIKVYKIPSQHSSVETEESHKETKITGN